MVRYFNENVSIEIINFKKKKPTDRNGYIFQKKNLRIGMDIFFKNSCHNRPWLDAKKTIPPTQKELYKCRNIQRTSEYDWESI